MKLVVLVALLLFPWLLGAEVVVEFKRGEWSAEGGDERLAERIEKEGVCFRADAKIKLKKAGEILADMESRTTYPIRFALSGQEGNGVTLDPFSVEEPGPTSLIIVTCAPEGIDVGCIEGTELLDSDLKETGRMGTDFEGLEKFLQVIAAGVGRSKVSGEKPMFILNVRSKSSWGQMVRVMQLIREGGCKSGVVRIDDEFPGLDVVVKMDPNVEPPVRDSSDGGNRGRIVVNLSEDGGMSDADGSQLVDEDSLRKYIESERVEIERLGKEAVIFLRGNKQTVFAHARNVIRVAAKGGVECVVFGVYELAKEPASTVEEDKGKPVSRREHDLDRAIPELEDDDSVRQVFLSLDAGGGVKLDAGPQRLDPDQGLREMAQLDAKLREIQKASFEDGSDVVVVIWAAPKCKQQRVIDVLNTLAGLGISKVTFTDEKPSDEK